MFNAIVNTWHSVNFFMKIQNLWLYKILSAFQFYINEFVCVHKILSCNVIFLEKNESIDPFPKRFRLTLFTRCILVEQLWVLIQSTYVRKETLSPIPIILFRSMLESPLIRHFPSDGDTNVHLLVGKCLTRGMGYVATEANKRISYRARKTTFAPSELRYTSQRTSGSAPTSWNQCIRRQGFIIIYRGSIRVLFRYTT